MRLLWAPKELISCRARLITAGPLAGTLRGRIAIDRSFNFEDLIWSAFGTRCVDVRTVHSLCVFSEDSLDGVVIVLSWGHRTLLHGSAPALHLPHCPVLLGGFIQLHCGKGKTTPVSSSACSVTWSPTHWSSSLGRQIPSFSAVT